MLLERICLGSQYQISIDYLLFGIERDEDKISINELKLLVAEGLFKLIQEKMITKPADIKVSSLAEVIANECQSVIEGNDGKAQFVRSE